MKEWISRCEADTEQAGAELAGMLSAPCTVCLYGPMGAGKTAFVRGMAAGLKIRDIVSSPTFTIVNEYPGNPELIHFDMYRLSSSEELFEIGWEDYLAREAILAVEWSENVEDIFDGSEVRVQIEKLSDTGRRITAEGGGQC
ncbi:MAG: tRNA (adenosine(37)-N6)-threonylcarbamoyltransferase complex ATPase subunit type 1 TsaE [Oscillospiraceae bacterium]|nr:tRNA (adenosine(37)-N6)-threonylcarbamoyltransferase complex ATPase subunit type 1 TsaE [Oscillospiraceae bacterium]